MQRRAIRKSGAKARRFARARGGRIGTNGSARSPVQTLRRRKTQNTRRLQQPRVLTCSLSSAYFFALVFLVARFAGFAGAAAALAATACAFARRDFLRDALFLWIAPRFAALSNSDATSRASALSGC